MNIQEYTLHNIVIMQYCIDFLGARELIALAQTCARMRAAMMPMTWSALIRARFPHKIRQPAFITRKPEYNEREFLLLLEDRATLAHAATYRARMHLAPEEIEASQERAISTVNNKGIIGKMIYIPRDSLILRGDIIHVEGRTEYFYIFDGVYTRDTCASASVHRYFNITLPITIKLGIEFDVEYFVALMREFDNATFYIDTNCANYSSVKMIHFGGQNSCEFEYGGFHYIIRDTPSFVDMENFMRFAAYNKVRIVRYRCNTYELKFD